MIHTPYDGTHRPFTIGLKPLDIREWIESDHLLGAYLAEKKRLYTDDWFNVFAAVDGIKDAQSEVLELLTDYLPKRFPETYRRVGDVMRIADLPEVKLGPGLRRDDGSVLEPLAVAGQLVQEDFVIMGRSPEGWRLAAASLCFPSAWKLREKIGKLMHEVHGPVPGFNGGTRNAGLIERMFDNLRVEQPVIRWNWTVFGEATLHLPAAENSMTRRFGDGEIAENVFLRLERQTLRKLPRSGEILFTIRTHVDPVEVLERHPDGAELKRAIADQVRALTPEELGYKGLTHERDKLLARLAALM
jgi:dimethylamine monooxygenase subunit A